jgi:hypothetical protein
VFEDKGETQHCSSLYLEIVLRSADYQELCVERVYDPSVLSDICGGLILRCRHAMGHRIKLGLQNKRVIRRMYKICPLTADLFCAILRVNLTGAAPAD